MKIAHFVLLLATALTAGGAIETHLRDLRHPLRHPSRILRSPSLVAGADPSRKLDIAMMVWLVRGNGRNILVDSGFYHEQFFNSGT